jgi:hypothetical protein
MAGKPGWIYVLTNRSMPGLVKIGLTTRDPQTRAKEISRGTGVPTQFEVGHQRRVADCYAVEQMIHRELDRYRVGKNREFFQMSLIDATRAVDSIAMNFRTLEAPTMGCWPKVWRVLQIPLWLLFWWILGPIWLWKRGTIGKVAAGLLVVILLFALVNQPTDETSTDVTIPETTATQGRVQGAAMIASPVAVASATATSSPTATPFVTASPVVVESRALVTLPPIAIEITATALPGSTSTIVPTSTPMATATNAPSDTPTAISMPIASTMAKANRDANLRAGPGTDFAVMGTVQAGDDLVIVGRNVDGDWYALTEGYWIAAFLVDSAPDDVPVAAVIPTSAPTTAPTMTPVVVQAPATPVPSPVQASSNPQAFTCVGGCATAPDPSCAIKGNVNSSGDRIYHMPGGQFYDGTDIKPEEGDRWFCTSAEAEAAGFRASQR